MCFDQPRPAPSTQPRPNSLRLTLGGSEFLRRIVLMFEEPGIVSDCSVTLTELFPDISVHELLRW